MPLIETLILTVGPAISKTLLKVWTGDSKLLSDAGDSVIDALTELIPDVRARNEAIRQLDAIGERAAESLKFIFETEGKLLMIEDQEALASLVAETLDHSRISAELLAQKDLDPVQLARHFKNEASAQLSLLPDSRVELFSRIIGEASESIVDIARALPNFTERTLSELLKRDQILIDAAHRTLESLDRIRTKADDDKELEAAKFETEYRRTMARNLDRLELFGVDLTRASRSQPLSVAYVSLDVGGSTESPRREGRVPFDHASEEDDESAVQSVEAVLAGSSRLVITGPAGGGKTTLVRWIAVRAASRDFKPPMDSWNPLLPFLVRLRQFDNSPFPRPEDFPSLVAPSISGTTPRGWVHGILSSGKAVVMVDGVDEVAENRREEVRRWLKEIVETFPECRFVVTSRPHAVGRHWLEKERFRDADLQPMDAAGIEAFVEHWHMAAAEEVQRQEEAASLGRLANNLKRALSGNPAVRRLATNPLLCGVICALHRDTNEQLPADRLDLYERCCAMLLERRDPESGLALSGYPRLSYREKRSLLDDLAYWMVKNGWSEILASDAENRLQKRLETFRLENREGIPATGETTLKFFLQRSGILREPVKDRVDFAHRTFQEFMAAKAAIDEGDIGVLLSNATISQWREVVALGAGLARPAERLKLIKSLVELGDRARSGGPRLYLLAAASLEASVNIDRGLQAEVGRRIGKLFPPKSVTDAMDIADAAGELAIPFLRPGHRYLGSRESAACVRALSVIGTREAVQAIAEYASNTSAAVLNEVVRASDRVDRELFLELIAPRLVPQNLPGGAVAQIIERFGFEVIDVAEAKELSVSGEMARSLDVVEMLPNLTSLRLGGSAVSDLVPLRYAKSLRRLLLERMDLTKVAGFEELTALIGLDISRCRVDAAQIAGMPGLEWLTVFQTTVLNPENLAMCPNLRSVSIFSCDFSLTFLKELRRLKHVTLSMFRESDVSIFGQLAGLTSLSLYHCRLRDFQWLSDLVSLETLDLFGVEASKATVIPRLPRLRKFTIKRCDLNTDILREMISAYPFAKIDK